MALAPGTRLGGYEITSRIGAGGMGEVYRAIDRKLKRTVAVKVLPAALSSDPDRLARFQREAEVLASLNHLNIAGIHGLEESEGTKALVMELVEGPTLADRIAEGPIRLEEAVAIATQIAEALEAAHAQGIIHRDLKPANVKVRDDGTVKVLDFGLAKSVANAASDGSDAPTLSGAFTSQLGVVLGTVAYMSPEQARGTSVDKRTDIWAFGCVLYEMLTGRRAFPGDTVSDTIAAILERDPVWTALPAATPPNVRRVLARCLLKDSKQRLRDMGDARADMEEAYANHPALRGIPGSISARAIPTARRLFSWLAMGATAIAAVTLAALYVRQSPAVTIPQPVARLTMPFTTGAPLATWSPIALSPDGRQLVYRVDGRPARLYIRPLDGFEARPLAGTEEGADPFFSPDGQRVGFSADGKLKWVSVVDGVPQIICDLPVRDSDGAEWQPDGTIFFASQTIWRVAASGGTPQAVTTLDEKKNELRHLWPQILPGGETVLFTVHGPNTPSFHIAVESLETHNRSNLLQQRIYARYASSGHLIYAGAPQYFAPESSSSLLASPFELRTLKVTGPEIPILQNVWVTGNGVAQFALSTTGTLVYALSSGLGPRTLVWVDRHGTPTPLPAPARRYNYPRLSPDEHRLAMSIVDGQRSDVWTYDLRRNIPARVTSDGLSDYAIWKPPDGTTLVYGSRRPGPLLNLYMQAADSTARAERLAPSENSQFPGSFLTNDDVLLFNERSPAGNAWHTSALSLSGKRILQPVITGPSQWYVGARISPDGHWVAYVSDEERPFEIYVQSYPSGQRKWKISAEGGKEVVWARDGRELYWRNDDKMMVAAFEAKNSVPPGKPRVLFEHPGYVPGLQAMAQYDVARDGRFVMVQEGSPPPPPAQLNVVLNWTEELKRLVPSR